MYRQKIIKNIYAGWEFSFIWRWPYLDHTACYFAIQLWNRVVKVLNAYTIQRRNVLHERF